MAPLACGEREVLHTRVPRAGRPPDITKPKKSSAAATLVLGAGGLGGVP
jgi:hypothetical protein